MDAKYLRHFVILIHTRVGAFWTCFENDAPKPPQISEGYANYIRETAAKIEREYPQNPAMLEDAARLRRDIEGLAPPPAG